MSKEWIVHSQKSVATRKLYYLLKHSEWLTFLMNNIKMNLNRLLGSFLYVFVFQIFLELFLIMFNHRHLNEGWYSRGDFSRKLVLRIGHNLTYPSGQNISFHILSFSFIWSPLALLIISSLNYITGDLGNIRTLLFKTKKWIRWFPTILKVSLFPLVSSDFFFWWWWK